MTRYPRRNQHEPWTKRTSLLRQGLTPGSWVVPAKAWEQELSKLSVDHSAPIKSGQPSEFLLAGLGDEKSRIKGKGSQFNSVQFSHSVVSDSLRPHELQYARPPCPSPTPRVYSNSCASSGWCHPAISSSVIPFSCPQSLPASGSFPMSQLFAWDGQSIGGSASAWVLPMNI